jgi:3',5'-cyclic-AMP phosphodiesterase
VPGWRILAINDFLIGSNLADAEAQIRFLGQIAATPDGVALALFTHRPLFQASPDEQPITGRCINPGRERSCWPRSPADGRR